MTNENECEFCRKTGDDVKLRVAYEYRKNGDRYVIWEHVCCYECYDKYAP